MDIEQTMKFILEMQSKRDVSIQQNNEAISRLERLVESNTHRISQLVDVSMRSQGMARKSIVVLPRPTGGSGNWLRRRERLLHERNTS